MNKLNAEAFLRRELTGSIAGVLQTVSVEDAVQVLMHAAYEAAPRWLRYPDDVPPDTNDYVLVLDEFPASVRIFRSWYAREFMFNSVKYWMHIPTPEWS
jgi:hypothetical protein